MMIDLLQSTYELVRNSLLEQDSQEQHGQNLKKSIEVYMQLQILATLVSLKLTAL